MNEEKNGIKEKSFDVNEVKKNIEKLLATYRTKKDDLEWADDEWSADEIQVELDQYAKEIKILQAQVREFEHQQS